MDPWRLLVDLAQRTGGVVSRRQARAAGVSDTQLRSLVHRGVIARVARGVYVVGAQAVANGRVISARHKVVVSHESAAAAHGVDLPRPTVTLHVTASRCRGQRADGIRGARLHRSDLSSDDVVILRGTPVTAALRTVLDIGRSQSLEVAVAVADSFIRRGEVRIDELVGAARKAAGRGSGRLRLVVSLVDPDSGSILESLTRMLLWRRRIASPVSQLTVRHRASAWHGRVDFAWPGRHAVLECDGYEFHSSRDAFQRDRRRWSAIARAGWRLAVVTWFDVTCDPEYVVALVRDLLAGPSEAINHSGQAGHDRRLVG